MSKQANKTAIGAFVLVALALGVAAIVIFGSGKFLTKKETYVAYFQGSVKGLRVGAPVVFRGVQVGEVTQIMLFADRSNMTIEIPVIFQVEPAKFHNIGPLESNRQKWIAKLIEAGLRAQLQMQSLVTGQLMINVDFYPDTPVRLIGKEGLDLEEDVLEIPTIQTSMQKVEEKLQDIPLSEIAQSIQNSLNGIERMVNSPETQDTLRYLRQLMKDSRNLMRHVDEKIDPMFADIEQTLKDAQTLLRNVDGQLDPLATSLTRASDDARKLVNNINKRIEPIQTDLAQTTKSLRDTMKAAEETLDSVDGMLSENSEFRYQIDILLRELSLASRSLRAFAEYLERNPDALLRGKIRREGQ
jgi:paraquat-inducible protein B